MDGPNKQAGTRHQNFLKQSIGKEAITKNKGSMTRRGKIIMRQRVTPRAEPAEKKS